MTRHLRAALLAALTWLILGAVLAHGQTTTSTTVTSTTTTTLAMFDGARQPFGTLATAQATTGPSASVCTGVRHVLATSSTPLCGGGFYRSIVFSYANFAGTATVGMEANCNGNGWMPVANSSKALTVGADGVGIDNPECAYRSNITICSGCSVTATWTAGVPVK